MKTVKFCDSTYSAYLICGVLSNEGIKSQVINETISSVIPYSAAIESLQIQVVVNDTDFDRAIEAISYTHEDSDKIKCPECGSSKIDSRLPSNNIVKVYFLFFLGLIAGSSVGYIRRVNYCKACDHEFNSN